MNVLLDTHIALWYLNGDERLSEKAKSYIDDWENDVYFSVASLWEIEIKHIIHPDRFVGARGGGIGKRNVEKVKRLLSAQKEVVVKTVVSVRRRERCRS